MKKFLFLLLFSTVIFAQQTITDLTVKDLKVVSTSKGSKPCPLMNEAQRDALVSPLNGQCIYNTTASKLNVYNGSIWKAAGGGIDSWVTSFSYALNDLVIESSKIYICLTAHTSGTFATDLSTFKWSEVSAGQTDHTALLNIGTNTHPQIDSHIASTSNPHGVTKTQIGLGSVVNTDTTTTANITDSLDKRFITDANLTLLGLTSGTNTGDNSANSLYSGLATSKQDTLVSSTNIKTINSASILGAGDLVVASADLTGDVTSTSGVTSYNNVVPTTKGGTGLSTVGSENDVLKISNGVPVYGNIPNVPKNYITATDGKTIGAWITYNDGASAVPLACASPPTDCYSFGGTVGTPTVTFATSIDSSISGTTNFLFTHGMSNQQGQGFSYPFTIDPAHKSKVLRMSLKYLVSSGVFADDGLSFWIYNTTTGTMIQPAPYLLKNSGIIEDYGIEFQTGVETSYRMIAHITTSTATAYTLRFSEFILGQQASTRGSAITDWVAYTPTLTGFGTVSGLSAKSRKVGDTLEVIGSFVSGTVSGTAATVSLGYGGVNGNVVSDIGLSTAQLIGQAGYSTNNSVLFEGGVLIGPSSGVASFSRASSTTSVLNANAGSNIVGNTSAVSFTFSVKIQGWSSSQVMSSDADTRIISFMGYVSTNQVLAATITNLPLTSRKDTHGAWTGSTYIVPSPGDYLVGSFLTYTTASSADLAVFKNGVIFKRLAAGVTYSAGQFVIGNSTLEDLKAGDIISVRSANLGVTVASDTSGFVSISKISGPSQIAASESVSALYTGAPPTGTLGNANNLVTYGTRVKDSHNSYNTSTGIYTVPVSGTYNLLASFKVNGTYALNGGLYCYIYINNILTYASANIASGAVGTSIATCTINSVPLLSGATVSIYSLTSASTPVFDSTAAWNFFSITRTGQY